MARVRPPEVDRAAASRAAVAARRIRASVKSAIRRGERSAVNLVDTVWSGEAAAAEGSLRVHDLLTSMPGVGPARAEKVMHELGIADSKRVAGLGVRQRRQFRGWLLEREQRRHAAVPSRLVVLAGPTAVGKGTVAAYIRENHPQVHLSVSATTRAPRHGEVEGVNYYFVNDDEFDRLIETGQMLETATVHNAHRYGTPRAPIDAAFAGGKSVLLEIDLQGARAVRAAMPEAVLIFLLPPSWDELVRRLIGRGTEGSAEQQRRLETAKVELAAQDEFDYKVVNRDVSQAAQEVVDLMAIPHNT